MCCGFDCTRTTLSALNVLYTAVSFIIIGVATYSRAASIVTNISIISGMIGCGVFLFFLSLIGFVGARKHNQVLLFFYMTILFALFVVQFSIATACLSFTDDQEYELARSGWSQSSNQTILETEKYFYCCGFDAASSDCEFNCCMRSAECRCDPCVGAIKGTIDSALNASGMVGLLFSFTEFLGVWLTIRYRNLKDPRLDPSAFL